MEEAEDIHHTIGVKQIYSLRNQIIEHIFADTKEKQGMRYAHRNKIKMELNLFLCA